MPTPRKSLEDRLRERLNSLPLEKGRWGRSLNAVSEATGVTYDSLKRFMSGGSGKTVGRERIAMPQSYEIRIGTKNLADVSTNGEVVVSTSYTNRASGDWDTFEEEFSLELMSVLTKCGLDPVEIFAAGLAYTYAGKAPKEFNKSNHAHEKLRRFLAAAFEYANTLHGQNS